MSVDFDFNEDDINALEKCINERWAKILEVGGGVINWNDNNLPGCELCFLNNRRDRFRKRNCENCIIYKDTGKGNCEGTPYHEAACGRAKAQQAMYDYLVDLLNKLTN